MEEKNKQEEKNQNLNKDVKEKVEEKISKILEAGINKAKDKGFLDAGDKLAMWTENNIIEVK